MNVPALLKCWAARWDWTVLNVPVGRIFLIIFTSTLRKLSWWSAVLIKDFGLSVESMQRAAPIVLTKRNFDGIRRKSNLILAVSSVHFFNQYLFLLIRITGWLCLNVFLWMFRRDCRRTNFHPSRWGKTIVGTVVRPLVYVRLVESESVEMHFQWEFFVLSSIDNNHLFFSFLRFFRCSFSSLKTREYLFKIKGRCERSSLHFSACKVYLCSTFFLRLLQMQPEEKFLLKKHTFVSFQRLKTNKTSCFTPRWRSQSEAKIRGESNGMVLFITDICSPRCFRWIKIMKKFCSKLTHEGVFLISNDSQHRKDRISLTSFFAIRSISYFLL